MDREAFEREVQAAARLLPEQFASALQNLEILVEDAPGPEVVAEFGGNLLGLYQGVPLPERSATYPPL